MREEEKKKKELEDADREKAAIKEKEEQEKLDEEEKKLKEEKERKEEEEYRKLAASFIVDEEGYDESSCIDGEDQENQLQVFIQYIKVYFRPINSVNNYRQRLKLFKEDFFCILIYPLYSSLRMQKQLC